MASEGHLGQTLRGQPHIIPNIVVDAPNGDGTVLAGEIIPAPTVAGTTFFAVVANDCADAEVVFGAYGEHMLLRKKTTDVFTHLMPLTLIPNPTATKNDYVFRIAVSAEEIHGLAMEAAANGVTASAILGPFFPPYGIVP